jgi:hypothetical protein
MHGASTDKKETRPTSSLLYSASTDKKETRPTSSLLCSASTDKKETRPTSSLLYSAFDRWREEKTFDGPWNLFWIEEDPSYSLTPSEDIRGTRTLPYRPIQKATSTCSTDISGNQHGSSSDDSLKVLAKEAYNALSK